MSWNPFKKPADSADEPPAPTALEPNTTQILLADDDPTDPLGTPAQLTEQATLLHEDGDSRVEHVSITNGQHGQQLLRLIVGSDQAQAEMLQQLFNELPEEFSGFRDLLLRPEA